MNNMHPIPMFNAPGSYNRVFVNDMLNYGQRIRDEYLWQYPLLPGAVLTAQSMVSSREFKVSGKPRNVSRTIDFLNNAQTLVYDGTIDYGLEQFIKRRYLDSVTMGRNLYTWGEGINNPLRYLDPYTTRYDMNQKVWMDAYSREKFDVKSLTASHPLPIGNSGSFLSPLSFVIPTAMLAWLVREHDRASADGRKIRDVMIVAGKSLAETMESAIKQVLELWTKMEDNTTKNQVPIAYIDSVVPGLKMSDMVARIGLANIPEGFNRDIFQYQYVNEIAAALGLPLRHFWNAERATNRALEEVQEARSNQKGPSAWIRTEQRLYNACGMLRQFGEEIRFGFVEEIDISSQQTNASILYLYAQALQIFVGSLGGTIQPDQLVAWLQREDILPSDLQIIQTGSIQNPETPPTPNNGKTVKTSDSVTGIAKAIDEIEYDEITMNGHGEVMERRIHSYSFEKVIEHELRKSVEEVSFGDGETPIKASWNNAVLKAREKQFKDFQAFAKDNNKSTDPEVMVILEKGKEGLGTDDFRQIRAIMDGIPV